MYYIGFVLESFEIGYLKYLYYEYENTFDDELINKQGKCRVGRSRLYNTLHHPVYVCSWAQLCMYGIEYIQHIPWRSNNKWCTLKN